MKKTFSFCEYIRWVFFSLILLLPTSATARVYIDITSFDSRVPIAVANFTSDPGLAAIIRSDLEFTHAFVIANPEAYLESSAAPFHPENWLPLSVEAVLKGSVSFDKSGQRLVAEAALYDPVENKTLFKRQYQSDVTLLRSLGHQISNDVYQALTDQESVFRTRLAYVVEDGGNKDIHIMDWDGGRSRRITRAKTLTLSPRWAPSGRYMAYSSLRGGKWGIYLLDLSQAKERLLYGGSSLGIPGSFTPNGSGLFFSASERGESKIFQVDLDGSHVKKITDTIGIDVSPSVSPDSRQIAFVSDRGGTPQVYIMNDRGGQARRITFEGRYNTSPVWSPRGDRIAFVGRADGGLQIFTISPNGDGLTQLTSGGNNDNPSWSPDGRYIAYAASGGGDSVIQIMLANGQKKRRISPLGQKASAPNWSPWFRF